MLPWHTVVIFVIAGVVVGLVGGTLATLAMYHFTKDGVLNIWEVEETKEDGKIVSRCHADFDIQTDLEELKEQKTLFLTIHYRN